MWLRFGHDEHALAAAPHALLPEAQSREPLGTGPFHELEVVAVEDDAAGIGVFPIHPHRVPVVIPARFRGHRRDWRNTHKRALSRLAPTLTGSRVLGRR